MRYFSRGQSPILLRMDVILTALFVIFAFGLGTYAAVDSSNKAMERLHQTEMEEVVTIPEGEAHVVKAELGDHGIHYQVHVISSGSVDVTLQDTFVYNEEDVIKDQLHPGVRRVDETVYGPHRNEVGIIIDNTDGKGTPADGPVEVRVSYEVVVGTYYMTRIGVCSSVVFVCIGLLLAGVVSWFRWRRRLETRLEEATIDIPSQRTRIIVDRFSAGTKTNTWVKGAYFNEFWQSALLIAFFLFLYPLFLYGEDGFEAPPEDIIIWMISLAIVVFIPVLLFMNYFGAWRREGVRITSYNRRDGIVIVRVSGEDIPEDLDEVMQLVLASPHGPDENDRLGALKVNTDYIYAKGEMPYRPAGYRCPVCKAPVQKGVLGQELCLKCEWTKFDVADDES